MGGLGWVSCSIIPKGVTSRGALLMCRLDIHHGGCFVVHLYINIHCNELINVMCKHEDILCARHVMMACK